MSAKKNRKIFYLNDDPEKELTAGGVLIYKFTDGKLKLLIQESRGLYEDLGGRADDDDKNIHSTIAREAYEESNKLLKKKSIKERLSKAEYVYSKPNKYIVYVIKASDEEVNLKSKDFGSKEEHDDIDRTIKWISLDKFLESDIIKYKLNFRLKNKNLFDILTKLQGSKNKLSYFT